MAFKQPRVPEYQEREGVNRYVQGLVLFLKDFCTDVWTADRQLEREIREIRAQLPALSRAAGADGNDEGGV